MTQSKLYSTNSGIFLDGGQACLVDPAIYADEIASIARFVAQQGATAQAVVLTHSHWDHIFGPEHFPKAKIVAQAEYLAVVNKYGDEVLQQITAWEAASDVKRDSPFVIPQPDETFSEEIVLGVSNLLLRLVHAPGHAADQLVIHHPESGTLWAADMLSDIEIPFVIHSLTAYQRTLAFLSTWDIRVLVPGHGQPTTDTAEIRSRLSADVAYLSELEEKVEQAVRQGKTVEETVALCTGMNFRHQAENEGPHRLNVESAYIEAGGEADPDKAGWHQKRETE